MPELQESWSYVRLFEPWKEGQPYTSTVRTFSVRSLATADPHLPRLDDFSGLGARLASIDQSIATISRRISSADHTPSSASRASEVDDLDLFYTRQGSENSEQDIRPSQLGEVFHIISRRFDDSECEHGSTVALSLIESCRRDLGEILGTCQGKGNGQMTAFTAKDASLKTELQILYDSFPFLNSCRDPDFSSDGKAISSPPRSFIHTVIDCFLSHINTATPIFDESRLRVAIEHNDSGLVSEFMEAKSLCYSNIILLTLGLKSRLARRNCSNGNGMDDDLLMSFWKNSRRAFGHLDNYLEPRLINVQALATLVSFQHTILSPPVNHSSYMIQKYTDESEMLYRLWWLVNTVRSRFSNDFATWRVSLRRALVFSDYPLIQKAP